MIRHITEHTLEHYERAYDTEHVFELPFDPNNEPEYVYISANGLTAAIGFLVVDDNPIDPIAEYDNGEFYQFNRSYIHHCNKPDIEEFKRIIRANSGFVFTVCNRGDGYSIASNPLTAADTRNYKTNISLYGCGKRQIIKGYTSIAENELDAADGYYICPKDATIPANYATAVMNEYSAFCSGDVYGVIVWEYTRESIADNWELSCNRENETWGYFGYKYAKEELHDTFKFIVYHNSPCFSAMEV